MQKIAIFLPSLGGGGAERSMILFALTLKELGYPVTLVCAEKRGSLLPLVDQRVPLIDLESPRMIRAVFKLRKVLRAEKPDLVFATIVHANLALILATVGFTRKPQIILRESTSQSSEGKHKLSRRISHYLVPVLYRRADRVIAVSEVVREQLIRAAPRIAGKVVVVETPVIPSNFITQAAQKPDHPWLSDMSVPVILGVGKLHRQKNFTVLIEAFAEVVKKRKSRLVILGTGPLEDELRQLVDNLGISSQVAFAGFALNPFSYMSRARVFALTSDYEGMPNVLVQALALAVPVVATNSPGGSAECLEGGKLGTLVPVGDREALTTALLAALDSPRREDAAEKIISRYGAEQSTRAYLRCIDGIGEEVSP